MIGNDKTCVVMGIDKIIGMFVMARHEELISVLKVG